MPDSAAPVSPPAVQTPPSTLDAPAETAHTSAPALAPTATGKRRVLLLTHRLPYPPDRGDRIRSYHLLKHLSRHFDVDVACTSDEPVWLQHHELLRTMASRVYIQPVSNAFGKVRSILALASGQAFTPAFYYRQGLADTVLQWHQQRPFDAVLTFCTGMVRYARLLANYQSAHPNPSSPPLRHILDLVDVDSLKWASYASQSNPPLSWVYAAEARRLRQIEAGRIDPFDAVTVISEAEAQAYRQHVGNHPGLTVVRNGVNLDYFSPLPDPNQPTLVFVGVLNYRPNYEGICWFVQNVMPALRKQIPDVHLVIVGRHPTPKVVELAQQPGVVVAGSVPDVRTFLAEASAVIAPLQIARGTQNKVLEAMACQRAVVCSPQAAAGISANDEEHFLVADQPDQWVQQIKRVLTDSALRKRIAQAARQRVEQTYSWDNALEPMVQLLGR